MFLWSHNLMSDSLHYDMSRLLAEICRGLDSVFDNKHNCHWNCGPVSNPGQCM